MAKKNKDYSRQILERIVGTKRKTEIADKLKEAFAEKYGIKLGELEKENRALNSLINYHEEENPQRVLIKENK